MHFKIDIEDYTASDSSSESISPITPISSPNVHNRRFYSYRTNQYSPSISSSTSSLYTPNSSESSASTFYYLPRAKIISENNIVRANNVAPVFYDIENAREYNDSENLSETESIDSIYPEELYFNREIKWRKSILFLIFIIFLFYFINSGMNNSLKNGYDKLMILSFRTLSDYPKCLPLQNEVWRLITNSFLHSNIGHLLSNAFFLYFIGYFLEIIVGHLYVLLYFFVGVIGGSLGNAFLNRYIISVGASHGAMSLSGALVGTAILNHDFLKNTLFFLTCFAGLFSLFIDMINYNLFYNENISYISHWVGYINGFLLSSVLSTVFIPKKWKSLIKFIFFITFLGLNIFLTYDFYHNKYKINVMNEKLEVIDFSSCCQRYIKYNFNHNFTCIY